MTREDVMKALECCLKLDCKSCPYFAKFKEYSFDVKCGDVLIADALALLREDDEDYRLLQELYQEKCDQVLKANELLVESDAEIKRLEKICHSYALQYGTAMDQSKAIAEIRAEILAEYISRVKKRLPVISPSVFEQIAKELESWTRN